MQQNAAIVNVSVAIFAVKKDWYSVNMERLSFEVDKVAHSSVSHFSVAGIIFCPGFCAVRPVVRDIKISSWHHETR